jgi:quercetin dioxygenase-like cupin family protein
MDTAGDAAETVEVEPGVHLSQLVACEGMSVQHVRMEPGAVVPEHSHHHEQVGYIYAGELVFLLEGGEVTVGPDEGYSLASGEVHGAENRGDETVLAVDVFSPPRPNPDWLE